MEIIGKLIAKGETQTFGNNGFRKREAVIETAEQYPQKIAVELVQDKTDLLDVFQIGEEVKIGINLRGREWTSPQGEVKYFNTIQGWRIERTGNRSAVDQYQRSKEENAGNDFLNLPKPEAKEEDFDDLPF